MTKSITFLLRKPEALVAKDLAGITPSRPARAGTHMAALCPRSRVRLGWVYEACLFVCLFVYTWPFRPLGMMVGRLCPREGADLQFKQEGSRTGYYDCIMAMYHRSGA